MLYPPKRTFNEQIWVVSQFEFFTKILPEFANIPL